MGAAEQLEEPTIIQPSEAEILGAAQAQLIANRRALARLEQPGPTPLANSIQASPSREPVFFCAGGCGGAVPQRGGYCEPCAEAQRRDLRAMYLAPAYESLSPGGALAWCRFGTSEYKTRSARAFDAARRLPTDRRDRALELLCAGKWNRRSGNLLVLGPKRIGKTLLVVAMGHKILDTALEGKLDAEAFAFVCGLRFITGLDLGRARSQSKLGEEPALIRKANGARLLILDEIGYEDDRHDPNAVRDVIYKRYEASGRRPTILTSGRTLSELKERYGAPCVERLTDLGEVLDLHGGGP